MQRRLAVSGRVLLLGSRSRPAWIAGTAALSMAKILENMEIGHNVLHGQWDWMNDPQINSSTWDWDTASTAEAWKHSHNYVHHTFTNILGKDKDLGYEIMRIDPRQKWHPVYLLQPFYNLLLMALLRVGGRLPRPRLRGDPQRQEVEGADQARAGRDRREGEEPGGQGLHRLAAAQRAGDRGGRRGARGAARPGRQAARRRRRAAWPASSAPPCAPAPAPTVRPPRPMQPPTWSATSGPTRSSSAAISPTRPTPSAPRRSRTRAAAAGTCASCRRRQHRGQRALPRRQRQPRLPGRAPPLPGPAEHPLRRDRAPGEGDLRALRAPLQQRTVRAAAGHGAADDPPPRPPRRRQRKKPGPYRAEEHAAA